MNKLDGSGRRSNAIIEDLEEEKKEESKNHFDTLIEYQKDTIYLKADNFN